MAALLPDAPVALVATGSWGRGEMCPRSDVDLLVLWGGRRGGAREAAERVLYPLWDSGRKVGHAVRTPKECVEAAASDLTVTCSLLDARLVAGRADLVEEMTGLLQRSLRRRRNSFLAALARADALRHALHGHTGRRARPHLKEGRGGLRDAAALRWRGEGPDLRAEIGVLLAVRGLLHDSSGRAEDVLSPDHPEAWRHTACVYAAARRIALAHRGTPPAQAPLLDLLAGEREEALDAFDACPPALPGWDRVACLPPANPLHDLAVDSHLLTTALEAAGPYDGFDAEVMTAVERPDLLLYAALLHDIGKGSYTDHSVAGAGLAKGAAADLGLSPSDAETLSLLVRHHLLLADVATRRDLNDEAALGALVVNLATAERLRLLYLLTRADSRATSATMWGDWRATLVREAFLKASELLERDGDHLDWRRRDLRQVLARHHPVALLPAIDDHLDGLPPSYITAFRASEQVEHFALMHPPPEPGEVRLKPVPDAHGVTLLVAARDRPGLLASVAAALTVHGIDILSARAFTRSDGVALESYRVVDAVGAPIASEEWDKVAADIPRDLTADVERRAAGYALRNHTGDPPPRVLIDNRRSAFYTVVEVRAPDRVGLLARLTRALYDVGLDVHVATIVTEGDTAIDTFHVWDADGQRLAHEREGEVRAAIMAAASPRSPS